MTKAVLARAVQDNLLRPSLPADVTRPCLKIPSVRSFLLFAFPHLRPASMRGRMRLRWVSRMPADFRRNP